MIEPSSLPTSSAPDVDSHSGSIPRHVAIIMDGNNRWARRQGLPGAEGHRAGEKTLQDTVEAAARAGIEVVTVFAFSSENWRRPEDEVKHLMGLFLRALTKRVYELHENGLQVRFIGDRAVFDQELRDGMQAAEELTRNNDGMVLAVAMNYGGQWDITNAARALAQQVESGEISAADIDVEHMNANIALADLPVADLLIRTGGDQRISNFLLWQLAYAEFYFTPVLWPDFDGQQLQLALDEYAGRQRRFGRSGEDEAVLKKDSGC